MLALGCPCRPRHAWAVGTVFPRGVAPADHSRRATARATAAVGGTSSPAGHILFPLGLPNSAALSGAIFRGQLGAVDTGATAVIPVVMSNGMVVLVP